MNRILAALLAGALFGVGLVIGGMTDPDVVLGFLDVAGEWNPTLLCVMLGATGTTAIAFRFVLRRDRPVFDADFHLPTYTLVDRDLVVGAVVFGVGWGLAGYCPAPVLVGAAGGAWTAWVFVPAMLLGAVLQRAVLKRRAVSPA
ncbi:hypothetical protein LYSHEL_19370 [Lysobacter helvus]|uniref:YeeE/YedE family protein n=2 Tax=Lysobacteraceae TaxID=32033 RepID=A0ABN6FT60_9GAMM|nr:MULTISPECIES: DUF6691 family protein [Lysobacter]BCT92914.1 hypothetical protein LYSCAS_19380 [Lysobacter caseinilyticus]BCT96066.1 hypothetical protein LYSHEL_19370 [Lysobacter helvus]